MQQFTDSIAITESIVFDFEVFASDAITIDDDTIGFTGILFWDYSATDAVSVVESITEGLRDSVYETGDYGTSDVFEHTDLDTVGVYE